jgi:hypothetical protein
VLVYLKTEPEQASEMLCFFKNETLDKVQKRKIVSFIFSHAVFSVLSTHDYLVMQALVWLCMVLFRAIWFGASYSNLRQPHMFKHYI